MNKGQEHHFAALGPVRSGMYDFAKISFDNTENLFNLLNALMKRFSVKVCLRQIPKDIIIVDYDNALRDENDY